MIFEASINEIVVIQAQKIGIYMVCDFNKTPRVHGPINTQGSYFPFNIETLKLGGGARFVVNWECICLTNRIT